MRALLCQVRPVRVRVRLGGGLLLLWAVTPVIIPVRLVRGFSRIEGEDAVSVESRVNM